MAFKMAETLGMTVAELKATMPADELAEWAAYYEIQADLRKKAEKEAEREQRNRSRRSR